MANIRTIMAKYKLQINHQYTVLLKNKRVLTGPAELNGNVNSLYQKLI